MLHDPPYLTVDRQYDLALDQIRRRNRIIRHLFVLALILTAIILVLAMMLLIVTRAYGSPACLSKAEARSQWPRSHIYWHGPSRCWNTNSARSIHYRGHRIAPDVLPVHAEIKQINIDANGAELTPYDEVMEKPQAKDDCCWPALDERSFKSRWDEIPAQWLVKQ